MTPLVERIRTAPPRLGAVRVVAVDGPSGSGKTVFARELAGALRASGSDVAVVPTDDFAIWDEPVQWWPRLVSGVLEPLRRGEPGRYRRVEWPDGEPVPGEWVTVDPPEVLVLEGVSAARRSAAGSLSLVVWVEVPDPALRLERAVARDGESTRPFLRRWQEFERDWFAADGTRSRADVRVHR
ncbi:uridine kinase family protein [Saccharopolyspora rosea]